MSTPPNPYGQPQYGYPPPTPQPYGQPPAPGYGYPAAPVPPQPVPPANGQAPGYGPPGYPPPATPQPGWGQNPPPTPPRRGGGKIVFKIIGAVVGVGVLIVGYFIAGPSVSSASVGDCVHTSGVSNVDMVKCTDSKAQYKVVAKYTGTTDTSRCDNNPESVASVWGKSGRRTSQTKYVLCLGPLNGSAPGSSVSPSPGSTTKPSSKPSVPGGQAVPSDVSRAKAGDCLRNDHVTSSTATHDSNPDITMLPCSDSRAKFKVVAKVTGTTDGDTACKPYPDANSSYYEDNGTSSFVLCLADVH